MPARAIEKNARRNERSAGSVPGARGAVFCDDMGESVKALVVPVDPENPPLVAELMAACRAELASYKCPRSLEIVSTIGRNAMGKINKRVLRAPYWEGSRTIG